MFCFAHAVPLSADSAASAPCWLYCALGVFAIRTESLSADLCLWTFFISGSAINDAHALQATAKCIAHQAKPHGIQHQKGQYKGRGDVYLSDTAKGNIHRHLVSQLEATAASHIS